MSDLSTTVRAIAFEETPDRPQVGLRPAYEAAINVFTDPTYRNLGLVRGFESASVEA